MYDCIVNSLDRVRPHVDFIIPSGTLIQQLRQTEYNTAGDLTEDGYHLATGLPRYALACLWHEHIISPYTQRATRENRLRPKEAVPVTEEAAQIIDRMISDINSAQSALTDI